MQSQLAISDAIVFIKNTTYLLPTTYKNNI